MRRTGIALLFGILALGGVRAGSPGSEPFQFAIVGDRTGATQPRVYEQVWRELAAEHPAFAVTVGDTIQGGDDSTAEREWNAALMVPEKYKGLAFYLTPGNHDIWSQASAELFEKHARRPVNYSFDFHNVHITVLDNSRGEQFAPEALDFLERDLRAHSKQPVKFIVSHRPSWLVPVLFGNADFPLHRLAKKYGVKYVIAGHLHEMLHFELDGVTYLSMPSAGGHLRASQRYRDGWFFGHTMVQVRGNDVRFRIEECGSPVGKGRVSTPADWGVDGLRKQSAARARWTSAGN
ncbi:MAG TPA: metallophosphoesterase [Bryobacteraceae bacterium]|nr:metallophosphoesterase [Bryobacteraceae bacterium]